MPFKFIIAAAAIPVIVCAQEQHTLTLTLNKIHVNSVSATLPTTTLTYPNDSTSFPFVINYKDPSQTENATATFTLTAPSSPVSGAEYTGIDLRGGSTFVLSAPAQFQVGLQYTANTTTSADGSVEAQVVTDREGGPSCDFNSKATQTTPAGGPCLVKELKVSTPADRGEAPSAPNLLELDAELILDAGTGVTTRFIIAVYYDYVSPTPACADVSFDHMEVVQVVQDTMNSVPLVAGKPTVARVFLKINNPPQQPVKGITGVLRRFVGGSDSGDPPLAPIGGPMTLQNVVQRDQITQSLNFELPATWIVGGELDLESEASVPACAAAGTSTAIKVTGNATVQFQNVRKGGRTSFTVGWIPYQYAQAGSPVACVNGLPVCPDESLIPAYDSFIKKTYPAAPDSITWFQLDVPSPAPIEPLRSIDNEAAFLNQLAKRYLAAEAQFVDHLFAVFPEPVSVPGVPLGDYGLAEDIPGRVGLLEQTHVGNGVLDITAVNNESHFNAVVLAHELGHLLGRHHTNQKVCTWNGSQDFSKDSSTDWPFATADVQEVGFDVADKKVTPANYGEVMSYCGSLGVPDWLSAFTYKKLIDVGLDWKSAAKRPKEERPFAAASGAAQVIVSGWAKSDGTAAALDPVYQVITSDQPAPSVDGGSHCLHFSNSAGALGDYCFQLNFTNPATSDPMDMQYFAFKIPLPNGATRLSLVSGGKELAALTAGAQPPSLAIASPHSGDQWNAGQQTITWSGSSPAGGSLVYSVLYSSDGGQSWLPLAMDITDSQFTFDPSQIKGGQNVFFRVMASSGLNSVSVDVGPIVVVQAPSIAASTEKLNFAIQNLGDSPTQTVTLSNVGTGPLTIDQFQIDNSVFRLVTPSAPLKIRAGSSAAVTVQWPSAAAGPANGNLLISSNDKAHPTVKISLGGVGPVSGSGITVTPISLDFGVVAVGQQSAPQTITVKNTGSSAATVNLSTLTPFAASPSTLSVPANGGTAMASVTFAPTPPGAATGNLIITSGSQSSLVGFVPLTGFGGPAITGGGAAPQISGIVNGASYTPKLARGSLGSIFGSNFTNNAPMSASSLPLPKTLNGVSVTVGGIAAPLIYVAAGQINFQVPYEVSATNSAAVIVTNNGTSSQPMSVAIADYAVGVFTYARTAQAVDPIIVHNSTNALVSPSNPAMPNEFVIVYATGIGKLNGPPQTGVGATGLASAVDTPAITIGGAAASPYYSGLTPGFPGLVQFNVQLPANLPSGSLPLVITFPGDVSPAVNLAVQGNAAATPNLSLSTMSLAFGNVTIGENKDLPVIVTNKGSATLTVTSVMVNGAGFSLTTASSFTVAPGANQTMTVRYAPVSASLGGGTLTITSNDTAPGGASVMLSGTGVAAANVILSDSFNRANASGCSLGPADLAFGGSGTHFYLPIFPGSSGPVGANIVSGALQNNGQDFGGVQLTGSAGSCTNAAVRGETLPQDLYISLDLLVPKTGTNVTLAGPYFRSRAAAAGDGIIGGSSAGYWVQLVSTGEVRIQALNPSAMIATTGPAAAFDASQTHNLQVAAQGSTLQVALDGSLLTFTQNGTAAATVTVPATLGNNNGTAGLAFGSPDNRGLAGGQRATNVIITSYSSLKPAASTPATSDPLND